MVRRSSANNLARFVNVMGVQEVVQEAVPMFHFLASDDQDSVRLLTVEVLVAIAEKVGKEEQAGSGVLLAALRSLFEDKSWRVRYMVADKFEKIATAVNHEVLKRDLVPAFVKLLKDTEAEVRTAIAGQIPGFCRMLDKETLLNEVMTSIEDLVSDQSQHVRAALGTQISGLAPILGKQETIQHLLPMFLTMLKDEFPDVRLHIISKLDLVNKVIGIDLLSQSLLPAIVQLAEDKQWRVRLAIIEYIPLLAAQLGVQFYDESLSTLCMGWLGDAVFSIRDAATQNLKKLTEVFGVDWARQSIIPKVVAMGHHPNYLYRMTTCFAISTLAPVVDGFTIKTNLLPILEQLSQDLIPNIRFNVAKTYGVLIDTLRCLPPTGTLLDLEKSGAIPPGTATATITLTTGKVAKSPVSGPLAATTPEVPEEDPVKKLEAENSKESNSEEWKCKEHAELVQKEVLPNLKRLEGDDDVDVRYYAATAAAKAGGIAAGAGADAGAGAGAGAGAAAAAADSGNAGDNNNSSTAMETSP
ncbi:hsp90 co-chaperone Cdc37 [Ascosphaera pollenicola]|nr:hsp90 co-chaperone Cdc37 [Ascosphaera pollenicola]